MAATYGFEFRYCLYGGRPLILEFLADDTETLTKGDIMNIENGQVDLAVTTDAALAGALVGPSDPDDATDGSPGVVSCTGSSTKLKVIVSPDAVYAVTDANARLAAATLDISGATGAQTVATSANTEFVVVETKAATEETLVMIIPDCHYLIKAA